MSEINARQWETRWNALLKDSVIACIRVEQWQPFTTINPDRVKRLGLFGSEDAQNAAKRVIKAGKINLIPSDRIEALVTAGARLRYALNYYSYDTPLGRIIPASRFTRWLESFDSLKAEHDRLVEALINDMSDLMELMRVEYFRLFSEAYDKNPVISTGQYREEFIENCIQDIQKDIPGSEDIRGRYRVVVRYQVPPTLGELGETERGLIELREGGVSEELLKNPEYSANLAAMYQVVKNQIEAKKIEVLEGLAEAEAGIYREALQQIKNVQTCIEEKGKITGGSSRGLKAVIEKIRGLNVFGGGDLLEACQAIENSLEARTAKGSNKETTLSDLAAALAVAGEEIGGQIEAVPYRGVRQVVIEEPIEAAVEAVQRGVYDIESNDVGNEIDLFTRRVAMEG